MFTPIVVQLKRRTFCGNQKRNSLRHLKSTNTLYLLFRNACSPLFGLETAILGSKNQPQMQASRKIIMRTRQRKTSRKRPAIWVWSRLGQPSVWPRYATSPCVVMHQHQQWGSLVTVPAIRVCGGQWQIYEPVAQRMSYPWQGLLPDNEWFHQGFDLAWSCCRRVLTFIAGFRTCETQRPSIRESGHIILYATWQKAVEASGTDPWAHSCSAKV